MPQHIKALANLLSQYFLVICALRRTVAGLFSYSEAYMRSLILMARHFPQSTEPRVQMARRKNPLRLL